MHSLWHKAWADVWQNKSRSVLAICSIAAGVCCVGILFGMIDLQLGQMDAAHQQSMPSHLNLILRNDADQRLLSDIKSLPGVAGVDILTPLSIRFRRPGDSEWQTATLMIRPDYSAQRYDQTRLQAGSWPTAQGVAIENLSASFSGIQIGQAIEIDTPQGNLSLPVQGIVRHPFVKPPQFGGQVHFFADSFVGRQLGVPAQSFRQLLLQIQPPYAVEQARNMALQIRSLLAAKGIWVNASLLQDPQQHWGRPFLAGVHGVLQIMAVAALGLACVLIFNTLAAHISQQTDQIGIMKALGATSRHIIVLYAAQTLLLALVAMMFAIPIGLVGAYLGACRLLGLFNIPCSEFLYSPTALGWMVGGGLITPLLSALPPILRGARMNVRQAMASYGLNASFGGNRFDQWLERMAARHLPSLYALALGNLFRRKARLFMTQSVLVIAAGMFLVLMSLIASLNLTLDNEMARSRFSVLLGLSGDQPAAMVRGIAETLPATRQVQTWQRLPIDIISHGQPLKQKGSLGLQLLALPAQQALYEPLIETGRWLQATDAGQPVLVISADSARLNDLQVGDWVDLQLGGQTQAWQIIGTYRWLVANGMSVEPVYALQDSLLRGRDSERASWLLVVADLADRQAETVYLAALKQRFQSQGMALDVYTTQAKWQQRQFSRNQFNPVIGSLSGLAGMIAIVGGMGLSATLAIGVLQRSREIGVLRAIGAPAAVIFRLFILEGLLHASLAWLVSVPLAYVSAEPLASRLGQTMLGIRLDFCFDWWAVGYGWFMLNLLAWLAAYWPARKAAGLTVRECLAH